MTVTRPVTAGWRVMNLCFPQLGTDAVHLMASFITARGQAREPIRCASCEPGWFIAHLQGQFVCSKWSHMTSGQIHSLPFWGLHLGSFRLLRMILRPLLSNGLFTEGITGMF